jgi:anti-sigma factor RsiW
MRCSTVQTLIDDHADGVLPAREAEAVRDHLEACAPCRDLAFAAKAASASLAQWGDLDPPADGFAKLMSRIEALPPEALRPAAKIHQLSQWRLIPRKQWSMPAGVAAAAALLAGFAFFDAPPARTQRDVNVTSLSESTAHRTQLRAGEVYVRRDPDDPALRRSMQRPLGAPGGVPAALTPAPDLVPVRFGDAFGDDRPVR